MSVYSTLISNCSISSWHLELTVLLVQTDLLLSRSLVVTAAGILGVSVNDALEAYGLYFVQHVEDQVR